MIVITTMNALPDHCYDCPCYNGEHGECEADKEKRSTFEYRPYWCPLEEVNNDGRPDRKEYIEVLSKVAKTVKESNEDAPIKISLECIEDILELLKEQEANMGKMTQEVAT